MVAVIAVLLALPASGAAATTVGLSFNPPPVTPAVLPADTAAPVLSPVSLSRSSFKATAGAKVSFALSEAGTVAVTVERKGSGRRVSGTCRAQTPKNKTRARCDRWARVGSFTIVR
jgi:hypothetical protein